VRRAAVATAALVALAAATPEAHSQSTPAFAGNYRLTLTFGPTCVTSVRSVSFYFVLGESAITGGSEVGGRPAIADETGAAEMTLHRVGGAVHGPLATRGSRAEREPITTIEGYLSGLWLVLDGTLTTGSGRPSARGTAAGLLEAGDDGFSDTLGTCTAADHAWSLDPV
jgi:hypothetical protein